MTELLIPSLHGHASKVRYCDLPTLSLLAESRCASFMGGLMIIHRSTDLLKGVAQLMNFAQMIKKQASPERVATSEDDLERRLVRMEVSAGQLAGHAERVRDELHELSFGELDVALHPDASEIVASWCRSGMVRHTAGEWAFLEDEIRARFSSPKHVAAVEAFEEVARHQAAQANACLSRLISIANKVMVLRIDLGLGIRLEGKQVHLAEGAGVGAHQAKNSFEALLAAIADAYGPKVLDWMWSAHLSVDHGYKYHLVLFLHKDLAKERVGKFVGDTWDALTQPFDGIHSTCTEKADVYRRAGIGLRQISSPSFHKEFEQILVYMTKLDQLVKVRHKVEDNLASIDLFGTAGSILAT